MGGAMTCGSAGGGACSLSMTDFATSAAERSVLGVLTALGFGVRLGDGFFGAARFDAAFLGSDFLGCVLLDAGFFAADFGETALGAAALRTGFSADGRRTAGLSLRVAAGLGVRAAAVATAASNLRRACLAALFSALNNFRACLRRPFAERRSSLAADARATALAAASLSRLMIGDLVFIYGSTRMRNCLMSPTSSAETECAIG
jgi:hypothetical protein